MPSLLGHKIARLIRPVHGDASTPSAMALTVILAMAAGHFFAGSPGVIAVGLSIPAALVWTRSVARQRLSSRAGSSRSGAPVFVLRFGATDQDGRLCPSRLAEAVDRIEKRLRSDCRDGDRTLRRSATSIAVIPGEGTSDTAAAVQLACRLQRICARPLNLDNRMVELVPAVGFARPAQTASEGGEELLQFADSAATAAQRAGPGQIRGWSAALERDGARRCRRADTLRRALDEGRIRPWFQPQLSTETGDVTAIEALARWEDPIRGPVPPADFLPDLAEAGLCGRLTHTMLCEGLTALRSLSDDGIDIARVAINLGTADLSDADLPNAVTRALERAGLPAHRLGLEVLESVLCLESGGLMTRNLRALCALGCQIDLDDFGTGNASITTIRSLPLHRLKIDRSFITGVDIDREQQAMVAAILTVAEQLGLDTLAEGVETAEEHAMVAQLGCAHVQGYAIAPPMTVGALRDWVLRHRAGLPRVGRPQIRGNVSFTSDTVAPAQAARGKTA